MISENYARKYLDAICIQWLLVSFFDHGEKKQWKIISKK